MTARCAAQPWGSKRAAARRPVQPTRLENRHAAIVALAVALAREAILRRNDGVAVSHGCWERKRARPICTGVSAVRPLTFLHSA